MSTERDTTRLVRSWLEQGVTALPDRVLDAVLDQLPATPQRRSRWPAWRSPDMNTRFTAFVAVAAAVVLAIVGYQFLPSSGPGRASPSPATSPTAAPTPSVTPGPSPTQLTFPTEGPVAAGKQTAVFEAGRASFIVPGPGWSADAGAGIGVGKYGTADFAALDFWLNAPDNVYSDPCGHFELDPAPAATAAGLAAAVTTIPIIDVVRAPSSVEVGGHPAQHLVVRIKDDIGCEPHDAHLWYDEANGGVFGGWRWAEGLGATYRIWIIDVDGTLAWIDAYTFPGAGAQQEQTIQQVIDSIQFE